MIYKITYTDIQTDKKEYLTLTSDFLKMEVLEDSEAGALIAAMHDWAYRHNTDYFPINKIIVDVKVEK